MGRNPRNGKGKSNVDSKGVPRGVKPSAADSTRPPSIVGAGAMVDPKAGHCRAGHAVTESQSRGALHLHALLWMLHGPQFHARYVACESCRKRLASTIERPLTMSTPGGMTARRLLRSFMPLLRTVATRVPWAPTRTQSLAEKDSAAV